MQKRHAPSGHIHHRARPVRSLTLRTTLRAAVLGLITAPLAHQASAVNPMPPYGTFPCTPATQNCGGGGTYSNTTDLQTNVSDRSSRSSCASVDSFGNCFGNFQGSTCPGSSQWVFSPKVLGVGHTVLNAATGQMQFSVEYDFPNNYCQTWDPTSTWPIPPPSHQTRLQIFSGANELVASVGVFEHGIWKPTLTVGCGAQDITVVATTFGASPSQSSVVYSLGAGCRQPDRGSCPAGGAGAGTGVGMPINVGSGDVSTSVPLFTLQQSPLPLVFTLFYHSGALTYSNVTVPEPLGKGWTHPFNQILKPIPSTNRLYHYTAEGRELEYTQSGGVWTASRPAEARGTVTLNSTTHIYEITDLDQTKTDFYDSSGSAPGPAGAWVSTTDRWGNTITGAYTSGNLTTITQSIGTNPTGRTITLSYPAGPLQSISVPETPSPRVWNFTVTSSLLMGIRDPDPLHTSINWRSFGYAANQLASITDDQSKTLEGHTYDVPGGRGITSYSEGSVRNLVMVEYDQPAIGQRRVTSRLDASTNQVSVFTLEYEGGRWLPTAIVGPCSTCSGASGDTQTFTYTPDNHVASVTDGRGNITTFGYDTNGNTTSMIEAQNDPTGTRTTTWAYGYAPWPNFWTLQTQPSVARSGQSKTTTRAPTGTGETTLTVTEAGYVLPADRSATSYITTTTYDTHHRVTQVDGPRTDVSDLTTYTYYADTATPPDNAGHLNTVTNAASLTTTYANYDIFGTPLATTDPNNVQTWLTTDARGRVLTRTLKGDATEPTDFITTYIYDGRDRLIRATLPRANGTAYGYEDGSNRLLDTIRLDASSLQQERLHLTLNDYGDKIQEESQKCGTPLASCLTWAQQRTESFTYDTKNRLQQIQHPVPTGSFIQYTYDANGMLQSVQDERHASPNTTYTYDSLNRLKQVQQTLAGAPGGVATTSYWYDAHDNLQQVTDPNGNVTIYAYDDFKRLQSQVSPVSGTTSYSYDKAGNLTGTVDANSATTAKLYDAANRVTSATSGRLGLTNETVTYTCDDPTAGKHGKGRIATMTDPTGSVAFAYDRRGLVTNENRVINGTSYTQSYGYDANGNRTSITYPSTRVVNYAYDYADRPLTATSGATSYVSGATYYALGPENTLNLGNGTTRTATFDLRYRPATLALTSASQNVSYTYTPDALGNITTITDNTTSAYTRTFGYDDLNRLTRATTGTGGPLPLWGGTGSFTYDSLGNRKTMNLGTRAITYAYDAVSGHDTSRLKTVSEGTLTVNHDIAGNEVLYGAAQSAYSPRNYLASTGTTSFGYDARGLRVVELTTTGASLYTITPCRVFDTRNPTGPYGGPSIGAGATRAFTIWGQCGIPATGPQAIALNLTAVNPPVGGSLTLFPTDVAFPGTSSISAKTGVTRANNAIIGLSAAGSLSLNNSLTGSIDMVLDVSGYFIDPPPAARYFFYTPEMNLLAETGTTPNGTTPVTLYEYIWFGGRPVAQETVGSSATRWTMTDHLGTPFLQMDAARAVTWRAEYEPFGRVYAYTAGSPSDPQPLRFPGQEERASSSGRSYNIFRWYRADVGQYTQVDPAGLAASLNLFRYAGANPILQMDPTGLLQVDGGSCNGQCPNRQGDQPPVLWPTTAISAGAKGVCNALKPGGANMPAGCRNALRELSKIPGLAPMNPLSPFGFLGCVFGMCQQGFTVKCTNTCAPGNLDCCGGPPLGPGLPLVIWLQPGSFQTPKCGPLSSTIFHEGVHRCGGLGTTHDNPEVDRIFEKIDRECRF